jgi:hypothetical protein
MRGTSLVGPSPGIATWDNVDGRNYLWLRRVWIRVIYRAISDWVDWRDSRDVELRRYAETGRRWIFEPSVAANSFESVCSFLDLSPEPIREWARALTKEDIVRLAAFVTDAEITERLRDQLLSEKEIARLLHKVEQRRVVRVRKERAA